LCPYYNPRPDGPVPGPLAEPLSNVIRGVRPVRLAIIAAHCQRVGSYSATARSKEKGWSVSASLGKVNVKSCRAPCKEDRSDCGVKTGSDADGELGSDASTG